MKHCEKIFSVHVENCQPIYLFPCSALDMVAGRDSKQPQIITRWYGQQVNLKCDVHHDKKVVPTFQWYKRLPRTHEKEKYLGETVWNTLTLIIVNDTYFGAYFCKAISNMGEVVELKFQIHKLGRFSLFCFVFM